MSDLPIYVIVLVIILLSTGISVFIYKVLRNPALGIYTCFFTSSILLSYNLPVVREKLSITEFVIVITWMAMLVRVDVWRNSNHPLEKSQRTIIMLGWIFIFWILLSFAVNNALYPGALVGSSVETVNFLYGFLLFRTVIALVDDWEKLNKCLVAWLLGAVVVSVFGIWAIKGGAPTWAYEEFSNRVSSTLRNENQVPSFLLPILPFGFFLAFRRGLGPWKRLGVLAILAASFVTLIGTGSRTALVMLAILVLAAAFLALLRGGGQVLRRGLIVVSLIGIGFSAIVYVGAVVVQYEGDYSLGTTPPWQRPVVMFYEWYEGDRGLDPNRTGQIIFALDAVTESPVFGVGPKHVTDRLGKPEIHNTYMGVLLELGIPGLFLFLTWLASIFVVGRSSRFSTDSIERGFIVWCLLVGMFLLLIYSGTMFGLRQRNFWLLAGLLVALPRIVRGPIPAVEPVFQKSRALRRAASQGAGR